MILSGGNCIYLLYGYKKCTLEEGVCKLNLKIEHTKMEDKKTKQ